MILVLLQTLDSTPAPQSMSINLDTFNEPDCLSSDKENMPPIELITPPSLGNLSIEEENNETEHKATLWEANVAQKFRFTPQVKLSIPKEED